MWGVAWGVRGKIRGVKKCRGGVRVCMGCV